jgi:hypothetical protein
MLARSEAMRVLVCGDRNWTDQVRITSRLAQLGLGHVIVHGAARGADTMAGVAAGNLDLSVDVYPAQWDKFGRSAGPIRNRQMLDTKPDLVIAFHSNIEASKGTKDCVNEARRRGIPVEVIAG